MDDPERRENSIITRLKSNSDQLIIKTKEVVPL